jgi:transcriptional regulator with XRE-family HTH domain
MPRGVGSDGVSLVLDVVTASPGLSHAATARLLGCRRITALALLNQALTADLVHEDESSVPIRAGAVRTVSGLYPGPAARALFAEPAVDGERLRAVRLRAGVSVSELAAHLNVSRAQVHRWEAGQQSIPPRVRACLPQAIEAAQTAALAPRPRQRDARQLRKLLVDVRQQPGRSRYALAGRSKRTHALLEQALASGKVHEAPSWTEHTRQPVLGVFPGSAPRRAPLLVNVADLRAARLAAGWSHLALAGHIGVAGTTVAGWERKCEVVPGWAADKAAAALIATQAARRDERAAVLAVITAEPSRLSRKMVLARRGYSRSPVTQRHIDSLITDGLVHEEHADRRGQRTVLSPGPAPAEVLSPEGLRTLRTRAGLTQRDLAAQVGTHVQAIRDWEGGHRVMSPYWQRRLLEHLEAQPARAVDAHEQLLEDLETAITEQPRPAHQLHELRLASLGLTDVALAELAAAGRVHRGRLAAPPSVDRRGRTPRGRVGYLPGPA